MLLAIVLFVYGYSFVKELHVSCFVFVYKLVGGLLVILAISFPVRIYYIQKRILEVAQDNWETYKKTEMKSR